MVTVGLDCSGLSDGFKAHAGRGTGRYVRELLRFFSGLEGSQVSVVPFEQPALLNGTLGERIVGCLPAGKHTARQQLFFPLKLAGRRPGFDLIHFPAHVDAPAWGMRRYVVTVLDLIPLIFPELYRPERYTARFAFARWLEARAIRNAALVLAISDNTARDVERLIGVPAERIAVTPLGVDQRFAKLPVDFDWLAFAARHSLPTESPLILYVGGIDPRKNYRGLLAVFKEVRAHFAASGGDPPHLILAGKIDSDLEYPKLLMIIKELALEPFVHLLGYVPDDGLCGLYAHSRLLFFPSLYEGFGLTPLEAMAAGLPVVSSNRSCLPQLLGEAAVLVDPEDYRQAAAEIISLLKDPERARALGVTGKKWAARYTWEQTGELTLQAYQRAATKGQG